MAGGPLLVDAEKVLFLLTSTEFPYIRDALDLLFLPSGWYYRFRYRNVWLPNEFKKKDVSNELKGMEAFLIHLHVTKESADKYRTLEFIPLRKAKIIDVKFYEEFLWILFELGDWVYYREKNGSDAVNDYHETFKRATPLDSEEYLKYIIYFANRPEVETLKETEPSENVIANWFRIVKQIKRLKSYEEHGSIFTKLMDITDIKNNKRILPKPLGEAETIYELQSDSEYRIDILQYYPYGSIDKPFNLVINTDDRKIVPLKGEASIQGGYDRLLFILQSRYFEKSCNSFIEIHAENQGQHDRYMISEPLIKVRIKGSLRRMLAGLALIFMGPLLLGISQLLSGQVLNPLPIAITSLGSLISALGIYILYSERS